MKTKSTYWSVIRSLVATIVAVIGFAMVSVGQDYEGKIVGVNSNNEIKSTKRAGSKYVVKFSCVATYALAGVTVDGATDGILDGYSTSMATEMWGAKGYIIGQTGDAAPYIYYLIIDDDAKSVSYTTIEPQLGPAVPNIAGGVSSVCLNNDDARGTIAKPTVAGVAENTQGWMINGEKVPITNISEYLLANMSSLDGKTLKYWAEDEEGNPGYSNGVALSVCLPEVGDIAGGDAYICWDANPITDAPTISNYPDGFTSSDFTKGWEIVESRAKISLSKAPNNFGKTIRYYVSDKYGNSVYSNEVKLMSKPTIEFGEDISKYKVCPNESIKIFPEISYNANGTTIKTAKWKIKPTIGGNLDYTGESIVPGSYTYIAYQVDTKQCGVSDINDAMVTLTDHFYSLATIEFSSLSPTQSCHSGNTVAVEITDAEGNSVTEGVNVLWLKKGTVVGRTSTTSYEYLYDCDDDNGLIELAATYVDLHGCKSSVAQSVTVSNDYYVYEYKGSTGGASNILQKSNWCLVGSSPCESPNDFLSDNCRYIINKSNVVLKSGENWTVSGHDSKIIVGDDETAASFVVEGTLVCDNGVNVSKNATLDIKSSSTPTLGKLNKVNSTVMYSGTGAQIVSNAKYNNLVIENGSRTVTFPDGDLYVNGTFSPTASATYEISDNNTILFNAVGDQTIPSFTYNNLEVMNGYEKTLGGDVVVNGKLVVNTSTSFNASDKTLDFQGSGDVIFIKQGSFVAGTSTVKYSSSESVNVAALNYYNLDLRGGDRVYASKGTIGISGPGVCFIPTSGETIISGSTIEFNSTAGSQQVIPGTTYNNLTLNSPRHFYVDGVNNGNVSVVVEGVLSFKNGVVTVTPNTGGSTSPGSNRYFPKIEVKNTNAGSIVYSKTSFSKIYLEQHIKSNLTNSTETYGFPVGYGNSDYTPITIGNITTGAGDVSIIARKTSNEDIWKLYYTGNYNYGSYSVVAKSKLNDRNSIIGDGNNIKGNVVDTVTIKNSEVGKYATISIGTRTISQVTYQYKCDGSDVTKPSNWTLLSGVGDNPPVSFDIDDAIWEINCTATIAEGKTMAINGNNSLLKITTGGFLKVYGSVSVEGDFVLSEDARLGVFATGEVNCYGEFSHADPGWPHKAATIVNRGKVNFYTSVCIEGINVTNDPTGIITVKNADFTLKQVADGVRNTSFTNKGVLNFVNSNVNLCGGNSQEKRPKFINANGAVFSVDNQNAPGKTVLFGDGAVLGAGELDFQDGSSLVVRGCDIVMKLYPSDNPYNGDISLIDGNLNITHRGNDSGIRFQAGANSTIVLYDTDNNGDGILAIDGNNGDCRVSLYGTVYAEGVTYTHSNNSGGNVLNAEDGSTFFIGNLGAALDGNQWETTINVKSGSTTYYCGNVTPGEDDIGSVERGGTLLYAQEYYEDNPVSELDFDAPSGSVVKAIYQSKEQCVAAAKNFAQSNSDPVHTIVLPVELTMLYGICKNGNVELHWQTASESNNEGFVILRSFDGVNFVEIAEVMGAGTSTETINYMYIDEDDKTGMVYYKLRQVDFDGKTKESKIVAVQTCGPNAQFAIAENEITVSFKNPEETNYVVVTSLSGKIVFSKSFKDVAEARIASPRIKGVYIISVIDSKQITSEKFIK